MLLYFQFVNWLYIYFSIVTTCFALQRLVIGLSRDLRGLAFAFNTKVSYMMLFDWLYLLTTVCCFKILFVGAKCTFWYSCIVVYYLTKFTLILVTKILNVLPGKISMSTVAMQNSMMCVSSEFLCTVCITLLLVWWRDNLMLGGKNLKQTYADSDLQHACWRSENSYCLP